MISCAAMTGCKYSVGRVIIVDFTNDADPIFIQIKYLLLPHEAHPEIVGRLLLPRAFSKKYHVYEMADSGSAKCHRDTEKDCSLLWPSV